MSTVLGSEPLPQDRKMGEVTYRKWVLETRVCCLTQVLNGPGYTGWGPKPNLAGAIWVLGC